MKIKLTKKEYYLVPVYTEIEVEQSEIENIEKLKKPEDQIVKFESLFPTCEAIFNHKSLKLRKFAPFAKMPYPSPFLVALKEEKLRENINLIKNGFEKKTDVLEFIEKYETEYLGFEIYASECAKGNRGCTNIDCQSEECFFSSCSDDNIAEAIFFSVINSEKDCKIDLKSFVRDLKIKNILS
jgi:hypothetical protein